MSPRELLQAADELSDDDRESFWRLATHAAYFAAFHTASELLERAGFRVPDADRAHAYLWHRLQNSGHLEVAKAGSDLSHLRTVRNRADYKLSASVTRRVATGQVALAESVVELLELVAASPETLTRIGAKMRDYEREVLRDVTWRGAE